MRIRTYFGPRINVCDIGGGTGADAICFAAAGHNVCVYDVSDAALGRALEAAEAAGVADQVTTEVVDLSYGSLPAVDGAFDAVYSRLALHYFELDTLTSLLREIRRVLASSGRAYLTFKSPLDAAEMAHLARTAEVVSDGVYRDGDALKTRFTLAQLRHAAIVAGWKPAEIRTATITEDVGGRTDRIKSGVDRLVLSELRLTRS